MCYRHCIFPPIVFRFCLTLLDFGNITKLGNQNFPVCTIQLESIENHWFVNQPQGWSSIQTSFILQLKFAFLEKKIQIILIHNFSPKCNLIFFPYSIFHLFWVVKKASDNSFPISLVHFNQSDQSLVCFQWQINLFIFWLKSFITFSIKTHIGFLENGLWSY